MEKMIKIYILNKVVEFTKKGIYKSEIINKGKKGVEKFNAVVENFWENVEKYIINEKNKDRKWIPNLFEEIGEETLLEAIKILKTKLDIRNLAQEIFDLEKTENPNIFQIKEG